MTPRWRQIASGLSMATLLLACVVGVPIALWSVVGWPLPTFVPELDSVTTAIEQRDIGGTVVTKGLAILIWLLWLQLVWAVVWDVVVNGKRLATGLAQSPAPLVAAPVNALARKLVIGVLSLGLSATPTPAPDVLPLAPLATNSGDIGDLRTEPVEAPALVGAATDGPEWLVADGDSLWSIAEVTFGDGGRIEDLLALNPQISSVRPLRPGTAVAMPVGAAIPNDRLHLPDVDVEVAPGDNLWHLSEHRLEVVDPDPSAATILDYVSEVVERNESTIDDPDLIYPGQIFTFPQIGEPTLTAPEQSPPAPVPEPAQEPTGRVAVESRPPETADRERAQELDGEPDVSDGPLSLDAVALGAGATLLAAGALDLVRRRRRYRLSQRRPGTVPISPEPELEPIERALNFYAETDTARWLAAAVGSLTSRPVWEGERVAQPVLARLGSAELEVELSEADPMAAPVPWRADGLGDGAKLWRLSRTTPIEELPSGVGPAPLPSLVTVGAGTLLNLEGLGLVRIEGRGTEPLDLVRSLVHELATSSVGQIDVRSTLPIAGTGTYRMVRTQNPLDLVGELLPWLDEVDRRLADRSAVNAYGFRLQEVDEPLTPVVVVTDRSGLDRLEALAARARSARLPIVVVAVGSAGSFGDEPAYTISLDGDRAILAPWGIETEPQLLTEDVARQLGALLDDASSSEDEPLLTGVQLSAPVAELRSRSPRPGASPNAEAPAPPTESVVDEEVDEVLDEPGAVADGGETVEIRVLGPVEVAGLDAELTAQQLSLVTYLACNGASSRDAIVDALWDGQAISKSRFPNLLAETRARIGRHRFPEARGGLYALAQVATDVDRFAEAVSIAQRQGREDAIVTLRSVMALVRGEPFAPPSRRFWTWVGDSSHITARAQAMVADAAARLARLEQERGDHKGAQWACEQGLLASDLDVNLIELLAETYQAQGKPSLAVKVVEGWEERVSRLDCGEPSEEPRKRLAG